MTRVVEAVLDDLRAGLARRAARRKRARAVCAAGAGSILLAAVGAGAAGVVAPATPAAASDATVASRLIAGVGCAPLACWPAESGLKVPKTDPTAAP